MVLGGIVGAVVIIAAAMKNGDHQANAQRIRKYDAEDERKHAAGAQTVKSTKYISAGDRQHRQQNRTTDDFGQAYPGRILARWVGRRLRTLCGGHGDRISYKRFEPKMSRAVSEIKEARHSPA